MKTFKQTVDDWTNRMRQYQQKQIEAYQLGYRLDGDKYATIKNVLWDAIYDFDSAFDRDPDAQNTAEPTAPDDMSKKELLFLAELLEQGAEAISNRVCSDMSSVAYDLFTDKEKAQMATDYEQWNSEGREESHFSGQAWPWMNWYAAKFRKAAS